MCAGQSKRIVLPPTIATFVKITVTSIYGSQGPALQYVGVETVVGESL